MVVDNTNPTVEEGRPLIALSREDGAKVVGYYFESHLRRCLERNRQRTGKAQVPDVALYATAGKLARPSYPDGFDELYDVRIIIDSGFEVHPYTGEAGTQAGPCELKSPDTSGDGP